MRGILATLLILQSTAHVASAQAFKDLAPDMAMKNLHNQLLIRRQNNQGPTTARFNTTVKNFTSLLVLNWMVANQEDTVPNGLLLDSMMQHADQSLEAAGVFDSRNLDIDFMVFTRREFEALQEKWQATRGDPAAEKQLSDETWQSFKTYYKIDLRAVKLEDFVE